MGLSRRLFTKEFKLAAVRRLEEGVSIGEVARGLEVNPNVLHRWRREFRQGPGNAFPGNGKHAVKGGIELRDGPDPARGWALPKIRRGHSRRPAAIDWKVRTCRAHSAGSTELGTKARLQQESARGRRRSDVQVRVRHRLPAPP
jgi:transposase-like protein